MKLLVSIHDATPAHAAAVNQLWCSCRARGVTPALLVVPNWHGRWPLEDHPEFAAWLRGRAAEGADLFLHGDRHDEFGSPRRLIDGLRAVGRTNREGEFLTLGRIEAQERIERGVSRLHALGLRPIGFIPPAWLARPECRDAVVDAGLAVSEDVRRVYLHRRAIGMRSPVVRWSARTAWRAHTSAVVAHVAALRHAGHTLVRIALHPQDLAHPVTAASIETALDHWAETRLPWSYSAL